MNKTAMQEFKDWFNDPNGMYMQSEVQDKIDELIKKEKQQIIEAWINGDYMSNCTEGAEKYYTETFTND